MTVESGETTRRAWLKIPAITLTGCLTADFLLEPTMSNTDWIICWIVTGALMVAGYLGG